jgi:hypothetical protein
MYARAVLSLMAHRGREIENLKTNRKQNTSFDSELRIKENDHCKRDDTHIYIKSERALVLVGSGAVKIIRKFVKIIVSLMSHSRSTSVQNER